MTSLPTIRKRRKRWNLFFLALPLMLMVLAFRYAPLFGWYLSLVDYKVGQPIFKSVLFQNAVYQPRYVAHHAQFHHPVRAENRLAGSAARLCHPA